MKKIALVFICRDNADTITRMIDSCLPVIDSICATDTGSTDNTIEIIQSYKDRLPVQVFKSEWKNFAYNRTKMMEFASKYAECDYYLVMDTDETLEVSNSWDKSKLNLDGYLVRTDSGDMIYYRERMLSAKYDWPWEGFAHEHIVSPKGIKPFGYIDSLTMKVHSKEQVFSANIIRNYKLLLKDFEQDPNKARTVFYLGESCRDLRWLDDAIYWYKKRIKMGSYQEEIYYSMLQLGIIYKWLNQKDIAKDWLYKAIETRGRRAEAMYELALIHHEEQKYDLAVMYCERILKMPETDDGLFVNTQIKEYLAKFQLSLSLYWAGQYKLALKTCQELIDTTMPENYKEQNLKNISFCRMRINEQFPEEKTLVIQVPWAWDGLGDQLFMSHIPKIAKEKGGYKYVYISDNHAFKSPGTKELVWGINPYVDGFINEGDLYPDEQQWIHWTLCGLGDITPPRQKFANNAMLHRLMKIYKLDDPDFDGLPYVNIVAIQERIKNHYKDTVRLFPLELYQLKDAVIWDGNWKAHIGLEEADVLKFFEKNRLPDFQFAPLNHPKSEVGGAESKCITIPGVPEIKVNDIFAYAFALLHCKWFITLMSGGAVLSAALHKPCFVLDSKKTTQMHKFDEFNIHIILDKKGVNNDAERYLYNEMVIDSERIFPKPISERVSHNSLLSNDRLYSLRDLLLSVQDLDGGVMEIGCYKGGAGRFLAEHTKETVILCDTFSGLPSPSEEDNFHKEGEFSSSVEIVQKTMEGVPNYTTIAGMFPDDFTNWAVPKRFKFIHLDVDLYESTYKSLMYISANLITAGGIVVIDDYGSDNCKGVTKAVDKFCKHSGHQLQVNAYLQAHIVF